MQSPDLFTLTRVGQGKRLTILVNDSGTISCDGAKAKPLPDPLLLEARDLATALNDDAKQKLRISSPANSAFAYKVTLQNGTISFPDTAAAQHSELAQAEQFVLHAEPLCGLSG